MDKVEFIRQFAALCLARAIQPQEGMVEVWWETCSAKPTCYPGLKEAFLNLRMRNEKFLPPVGELIELAVKEAGRIRNLTAPRLYIPEVTDRQRDENKTLIRECIDDLSRRFGRV